MSMSTRAVPLHVVRAQEMAEEIEAIIASNDTEALAKADYAVVYELARRYVFETHKKKVRQVTGQIEKVTKSKVKTDALIQAKLTPLLSDIAEELYEEWDAGLLARSFDINGRTVTYGQATLADHRERMKNLSDHAAGTMRTAAIHRRAIDDIVRAGVTCLADLV